MTAVRRLLYVALLSWLADQLEVAIAIATAENQLLTANTYGGTP